MSKKKKKANKKVKNFFSKWQLKQMNLPTPEEFIETSKVDKLRRPNPDYAKKFANEVLGHNFDTKVLSNHYYSDRREACICLKMTIRNKKGDVKKAEQFGGFTFQQGEKTSVSHAFKSAETNAFIKILFDLGFFQDLRISNKDESSDKETVEQETEKKSVDEVAKEVKKMVLEHFEHIETIEHFVIFRQSVLNEEGELTDEINKLFDEKEKSLKS